MTTRTRKRRAVIYVTVTEELQAALLQSLAARSALAMRNIKITDFVVEAAKAHIKKWGKR